MLSLNNIVEIYKINKEWFPVPIIAVVLGVIGTTVVIKKRKEILACAVRTGKYLHYMAVSRKHRGEGYGKILLKKVLPKIKQLRVNVRNKRAIELYQSNGFRIVGVSRWITGKKYLMVRE